MKDYAKAIFVACVLSMVFLLTGTACGQGATKKVMTADGLSLPYPSDWEVLGDGALAPPYGGTVVVQPGQFGPDAAKDVEGTLNALIETLEGTSEEDGVVMTIGISKDKRYRVIRRGVTSYRYDATLTKEGVLHRGYLEVIPVGGWYVVFAFVPSGLYESKREEIVDVLNGILVPQVAEAGGEDGPAQPDEEKEDTPAQPKGQDGESEGRVSFNRTDEPRDVFRFNDGYNDSNEMYNRYVGSITNMSDETRYFVKVRGTFMDDNGNSIDTDWTYACGDEGLRPGETTTFTLSVRHDSRISKISYSVYDYR